MTSRERVLAVLEGRKPDRLPCMPITMMFAGDQAGVNYTRYASDHRVLVEAQLKTAEEFDFDYVSAISDPAREAADYGAFVEWFDNQPPALVEAHSLLSDKGLFKSLPRLADVKNGRVEDRVRAIELFKRRIGSEKFIEGWVEGPCAEAADLRGINRLMIDFHDDPDFVRELFDVMVSNAIHFARVQIDAGADIIGVGDAAASLVGPRAYERFVWPAEKQLVDGIHKAGGKVRLHICGNTRRILSGIGSLLCEMVDIDYAVPMVEARSILGPTQVIAGNLNPVQVLLNGTPEIVTAAIRDCHAAAGDPYIVAAGCEVPRGTPIKNVLAMSQYAKSQSNLVGA